jgi:hypothetical protein
MRTKAATEPAWTKPRSFPGVSTSDPPVLEEGIRLADPEPLPSPPPKHWKDVPKPPGIAALPVDFRGYPIFFSVWDEGRPEDGSRHDFRVLNVAQHLRCATERLCAICGEPLDKMLYFVGGPMCLQNRIFGDGPMHEDCARYSMKVCPHLSQPDFGYHERPGDSALLDRTDPNVIHTKPVMIVLYKCADYRLISGGRGKPLYVVQPAFAVEWYTNAGEYRSRTRPTRYAQ